MDYRNAALTALSGLVLFLGSMVAGTWNNTTSALNEVAQIVAKHGERLDHQETDIAELQNRIWEYRQ